MAFLKLWLGMTSLELWLGMVDEHEHSLSCDWDWQLLLVWVCMLWLVQKVSTRLSNHRLWLVMR